MAGENQYYNVDVAMLGDLACVDGYDKQPDFEGRFLELVCKFLTEHGYPAVPVTDSWNGAVNPHDDENCVEPPENVWCDALAYASDHVND